MENYELSGHPKEAATDFRRSLHDIARQIGISRGQFRLS